MMNLLSKKSQLYWYWLITELLILALVVMAIKPSQSYFFPTSKYFSPKCPSKSCHKNVKVCNFLKAIYGTTCNKYRNTHAVCKALIKNNCYCPPCVSSSGSAVNIDCFTGTGVNYLGNAHTSVTGRTCDSWSNAMVSRHYFKYPDLLENYCRNPFGNHMRPWCYVSKYRSSKYQEDCDVPRCNVRRNTCWSRHDLGRLSYNGTESQTSIGRCVKWLDVKLEGKPFNVLNFPDNSLHDAENFCRNPASRLGGPYCYVNLNGTLVMQTCDISACNGAQRPICGFPMPVFLSRCPEPFQSLYLPFNSYKVLLTQDFIFNNSHIKFCYATDPTRLQFHGVQQVACLPNNIANKAFKVSCPSGFIKSPSSITNVTMSTGKFIFCKAAYVSRFSSNKLLQFTNALTCENSSNAVEIKATTLGHKLCIYQNLPELFANGGPMGVAIEGECPDFLHSEVQDDMNVCFEKTYRPQLWNLDASYCVFLRSSYNYCDFGFSKVDRKCCHPDFSGVNSLSIPSLHPMVKHLERFHICKYIDTCPIISGRIRTNQSYCHYQMMSSRKCSGLLAEDYCPDVDLCNSPYISSELQNGNIEISELPLCFISLDGSCNHGLRTVALRYALGKPSNARSFGYVSNLLCCGREGSNKTKQLQLPHSNDRSCGLSLFILKSMTCPDVFKQSLDKVSAFREFDICHYHHYTDLVLEVKVESEDNWKMVPVPYHSIPQLPLCFMVSENCKNNGKFYESFMMRADEVETLCCVSSQQVRPKFIDWPNATFHVMSLVLNWSSFCPQWNSYLITAKTTFGNMIQCNYEHQTIVEDWSMEVFGLPQPMEGCPSGFHSVSVNFTMEKNANMFMTSHPLNWDGDYNAGHPEVHLKICKRNTILTVANESKEKISSMPLGSYCVFGVGGSCPNPEAFSAGKLFFMNELDEKLPEESYHKASNSPSVMEKHRNGTIVLHFCCQSSNFPATRPMRVPSTLKNQTFNLLRYGEKCQELEGYQVTNGHICIDAEDSPKNRFGVKRAAPYHTIEPTPVSSSFHMICDFQINICNYEHHESKPIPRSVVIFTRYVVWSLHSHHGCSVVSGKVLVTQTAKWHICFFDTVTGFLDEDVPKELNRTRYCLYSRFGLCSSDFRATTFKGLSMMLCCLVNTSKDFVMNFKLHNTESMFALVKHPKEPTCPHIAHRLFYEEPVLNTTATLKLCIYSKKIAISDGDDFNWPSGDYMLPDLVESDCPKQFKRERLSIQGSVTLPVCQHSNKFDKNNQTNTGWQKGSYCIIVSNRCPLGSANGFWAATLGDGFTTNQTSRRLYLCCRTDAVDMMYFGKRPAFNFSFIASYARNRIGRLVGNVSQDYYCPNVWMMKKRAATMPFFLHGSVQSLALTDLSNDNGMILCHYSPINCYCHEFAECVPTLNGSYNCECFKGFDGDGVNNCIKRISCADCTEEEVCVNSTGRFECKCRDGYSKTNGRCSFKCDRECGRHSRCYGYYNDPSTEVCECVEESLYDSDSGNCLGSLHSDLPEDDPHLHAVINGMNNCSVIGCNESLPSGDSESSITKLFFMLNSNHEIIYPRSCRDQDFIAAYCVAVGNPLSIIFGEDIYIHRRYSYSDAEVYVYKGASQPVALLLQGMNSSSFIVGVFILFVLVACALLIGRKVLKKLANNGSVSVRYESGTGENNWIFFGENK